MIAFVAIAKFGTSARPGQVGAAVNGGPGIITGTFTANAAGESGAITIRTPGGMVPGNMLRVGKSATITVA